VKLIMSMRGSLTSAAPVSGPPGRTWNSPLGKPAASSSRAKLTPPATGVCTSGFRMTALPIARAGPIARAASMSGEFQGVMMPMTPTGIRRAML